ncbi:hypothetical protein BTA51_03215 [Hahella sp. CCB-MM4]|uniref:cupredoxin domain-containing protein n=1 Tax=Hahella sp. (strain CCB-MM4) TaxID=1926491 RepID=UPI000B9B6F99|nr:cupredoxin domain-containing protein [Hahella sp. CCB-MM4]OZG75401.1 hypothetical protein BTA51_03215 [Hahella sp. CCB-MM4]
MKKLLLALVVTASAPAFADVPVFNITIKDHVFSPAQTEIPANQQVKLVIDNQDATPEEFEGENFDIEKIIPGNTQASILVGPFAPGEYEFVGEFHEDTAKGELIAK